MCGNFDGDSGNDFKTIGGEFQATPRLFGHEWKTDSNCVVPPEPVHPCETEVGLTRKAWAEYSCDIIKGEIFKSCHNVVM